MNAGLCGKIRVMSAPHSTPVPTLAEAAQWAPEQIVGLAQVNVALQRDIDAMRLEFAALKHQLEWFRRQLFGQKSEKRLCRRWCGVALFQRLALRPCASPIRSPYSCTTPPVRVCSHATT